MALVICKKCGELKSDKERKCINCGYVERKQPKKKVASNDKYAGLNDILGKLDTNIGEFYKKSEIYSQQGLGYAYVPSPEFS